VVSHNIIVIHNQLLRFPDISFFVSPIPLHIAAMVILFGQMSRCDSLTRQVALEDVWMALDMLPSFRWRWERREMNGSHPLIAKLTETVLGVNLRQAGPSSHPVLIPELDWDIESTSSPASTHSSGGGTSASVQTNAAHTVAFTPTSSIPLDGKGDGKRVRGYDTDASTPVVTSAPSPKRVKAEPDWEGPSNEEARKRDIRRRKKLIF
jgi:hypothetical protein